MSYLLHKQNATFVQSGVSTGCTADEGRAYVGYGQGEAIAVRFTPTAGFVQTPEPKDGARIDSAQSKWAMR